jgi:allantoin racemase
MKLLVINPNSGQATTDRLTQFIGNYLPPSVSFDCITAVFGFDYIASEESFAVASHAVLETWKRYSQQTLAQPDRILLACFGDPGLFALKEICPQPVHALSQAAFIEAASHGQFAIVTGGQRWKPMLQRHANALGFGSSLLHIETVDETGAQLLADPALAKSVLTQACKQAQASKAKAIILGGAGLAGYAKIVQDSVDIPVIDSVEAGVRAACF